MNELNSTRRKKEEVPCHSEQTAPTTGDGNKSSGYLDLGGHNWERAHTRGCAPRPGVPHAVLGAVLTQA